MSGGLGTIKLLLAFDALGSKLIGPSENQNEHDTKALKITVMVYVIKAISCNRRISAIGRLLLVMYYRMMPFERLLGTA